MSESMETPVSMRALAKMSADISERVETEVPVLVIADDTNLRNFSAMVFEQIDTLVRQNGGAPSFTEEELLRYFVTAMKVRVERSTPPHIRLVRTNMRTDDRWALPPTLAYVINAIGQVRYGPGEVLFYPVWNKAADDLVMSQQERDRMTARLRSLEASGLRFVRAIESKREGVIKVMVLTFMNTPSGGEWVSPEPVGVVDAFTASLTGLRPVGGLSTETPVWLIPYKVDERKVVQYLPESALLNFSER